MTGVLGECCVSCDNDYDSNSANLQVVVVDLESVCKLFHTSTTHKHTQVDSGCWLQRAFSVNYLLILKLKLGAVYVISF